MELKRKTLLEIEFLNEILIVNSYRCDCLTEYNDLIACIIIERLN
jgi:hypothetical protein